MPTKNNLDEICLDPGIPLVSRKKALELLKYHQLEDEMDARLYARKLWEIYDFAVEQINSNGSESQFNKEEIVKSLQHILANGRVDIRTKRGMAILKTDKARYGFKLDNPSMHMRDVRSILTPFGFQYMLRGKIYHVAKTVGGYGTFINHH